MKKGQIVRINHPAFGEYGLVTQIAEDVVVIIAATGIVLPYERNDALNFERVGRLVIGKKYSVLGKRFCRVTCGPHTHDVCVSGGSGDGYSADVIRKLAFPHIALLLAGSKKMAPPTRRTTEFSGPWHTGPLQ